MCCVSFRMAFRLMERFFWRRPRHSKVAPAAGLFFKIHFIFFWAAGGVFTSEKKSWKTQYIKICKKITRNPVGVSKLVTGATIFQPHIWFDEFCILCMHLSPGTDLKYKPPPYLRKLTFKFQCEIILLLLALSEQVHMSHHPTMKRIWIDLR